ncbi:LamG domain-containing protein [Mucilaginibacter rigui]|uniref:LamG domain-containing protein n=1 Tax=Mucilaginibacter rigui TaxID=534635 RepID=A0ABR7X050_9SPHI|nr:LamG domain-containing protein [Mucilaginibacter rigui]MBD1383978.1 LamG domain-containing protein [Mucilaginibacter rigui]
MASRNGLNPKIRGSKGVGFNRALPAPFGFDKSFKGVNDTDYFTVPGLVGQLVPMTFTLEFWTKPALANIGAYQGYFLWVDSSGKSAYVQIRPPGENCFSFFFPANTNVTTTQFVLDVWNHIVFTVDFVANRAKAIVNGNVASAISVSVGAYTQAPFNEIRLLDRNSAGSGKLVVDEFRVYNRIISDVEIVSNYNIGLGNNASITEGLLTWYKFEAFENLDFSLLQDNSEMHVGMRDYSGHNNHALPNPGMVTNPALPNYPLNYF